MPSCGACTASSSSTWPVTSGDQHTHHDRPRGQQPVTSTVTMTDSRWRLLNRLSAAVLPVDAAAMLAGEHAPIEDLRWLGEADLVEATVPGLGVRLGLIEHLTHGGTAAAVALVLNGRGRKAVQAPQNRVLRYLGAHGETGLDRVLTDAGVDVAFVASLGRRQLLTGAVRATGELLTADQLALLPAPTVTVRISTKGGQCLPLSADLKEPPMPANVPSPAASAHPDPLKVGARLLLRDGEQFAGSGSVKDTDGLLALAAAVDTPDGRQIHLGVPVDPGERKNWRGAHAPDRETRADDDGDDYTVDTYADVTVVLDATDTAALAEEAEDVIARAEAADREYRQLCKDFDRLFEQRTKLEGQRFATPAQADRKISLDAREQHELKFQRHRRDQMQACAARLSPADRAVYDALQRQIDAAGQDVWNPGEEQQAAALCGLTVDEFGELQALKKIHWRARSRQQQDRLDHLDHRWPPLLEQQAALVCGLSIEEFREMWRLQTLHRRRTLAEQARLDHLDNSPRGAIAASPGKTARMRGGFLSVQHAHHATKTDLVGIRQDQAALEQQAQPLDTAAAAELHRVCAALDAARDRYDELSGGVSASVQIPARNGGFFIVQAVQQEDGGVRYQASRRPADADADWTPGDLGDPFTSTAAGLRKLAKLATQLAA